MGAKLVRLVVCGVIALVCVAPASASKPTPEQAIAALNAWRAQTGIPPITTIDAQMNEGCRLHNAYLSANPDVRGLAQHTEQRNRPGYTELGARAGGASSLSWPGSGLPGPPDGLWYDAVYHRMGLLDPRATIGWFDGSSGRACMGLEGDVPAPSLSLHPWPANGVEDVPLAFASHEYPDPYAMVPASVKQLGFPLSVSVNGPWTTWSEGSLVESATLTRDGGQAIPVTVLDRRSEVSVYMRSGFALLPHKAFEPGAWYTAHAVGYVEYNGFSEELERHSFDLTWRFRAAQTENLLDFAYEDGRLRLEGGNGQPATVVVRDAVGGAERARRVLRRRDAWRLPLPAGEYEVCITQPETTSVRGFDDCHRWAHMTLDAKLTRGRAKVTVAVPDAGVARKVRIYVSVNDPTCCWRASFRRHVIATRSSKTVTFRLPPAIREVEVWAGVRKQRAGEFTYRGTNVKQRVRR